MNRKFLVFNLQTKELIPVRSGFVFGRFVDCDIQILEKSISRKHASIDIKGDQLFLKDLGSSNGTFLNGKALTEEVSLHSGDRIQIGESHFEIRFSEGTTDASSFPEPKLESKVISQPKAPPLEVKVLGLVFELFGGDLFRSQCSSDEFSKKILQWEDLARAFVENHQGKIFLIKQGSMTITWDKVEISSRFLALSLARTLILGAKRFWAHDQGLENATESMICGRCLLYMGESISEGEALLETIKGHSKAVLASVSFLENWEDKPTGKEIDGLSRVVELSEL